MSEYDNTNKGALFNAHNCKIKGRGTIHIGQTPSDYVLVEEQNKHGQSFFNLYVKSAKIFKNDNKRNDDDADMSGTIESHIGEYRIWLRERTSKNGNEFISASVAPKKEKEGGF